MKKGYECVHRKDNGRLTVVKFKEGIEIVCQKCQTCWHLDLPFSIGMTINFKTMEEDE